jgi:hypothetical protein
MQALLGSPSGISVANPASPPKSPSPRREGDLKNIIYFTSIGIIFGMIEQNLFCEDKDKTNYADLY